MNPPTTELAPIRNVLTELPSVYEAASAVLGYLLLAVAVSGVVKGLALDVTLIMSAVAFGYFVYAPGS